MAEVRCNGCRAWFDGGNRECPDCGHPRPGYNKWLVHAQLNVVMNQQKARAIANR